VSHNRDTFVSCSDGGMYILFESTDWTLPRLFRAWYPVRSTSLSREVLHGQPAVHLPMGGAYSVRSAHGNSAIVTLERRGETLPMWSQYLPLEPPKARGATSYAWDRSGWVRIGKNGRRTEVGFEFPALSLDPATSGATRRQGA